MTAQSTRTRTRAPAEAASANGRPAPQPAPPASAAAVFAPVAADLTAFAAAMRGAAEVDHPLLRQTLRLTLSATGKRLRPALVFLAARLHHNTQSRRVDLALAAELLHTATLVHDDVIDVSDARRGHPTVNVAFGNTLAVLTGDYLFGKSGQLVAGLGSTGIMGVFSRAVMEVVQGEMLRPTIVDTDLDTAERDYLAKIRGKTAALLAMCTHTGAMLDAEDDTVVVERLRDYGMDLGMAFQIVDDVLDFTATEEQLGKPVGSDLRQGILTLPALYYLRDGGPDALVRGLLSGDDAAAARATDAVEQVRASRAIERSLDRARAFAAAATARLEGLPASACMQALHDLAHYVVDRRD